ncbi:TOMM precursor leader peptide-binding protein [Streptomyces sp. NPDC005805]|uniref:TOMM precursor leader peptide-binding protein n=1 Tax=Streptomyces sp. NPDC005805 TaxID=3157068 RepID=UPI0033FDC63D
MRPMMKPALRRAWRDRQSVQFGVTPERAMTVGPLDTATGSLVDLLDGTRGMELLRAEARARGLPEGRADALVRRLADAGLLDDTGPATSPAAGALRGRAAAVERLRPDLASLSLVHPEPGGAFARMGGRRSARVLVRGAGRVGAAIAATLSAAGIGQVEVRDGGVTEPGDTAPGGIGPEETGERRDAAARRLVRRSAPDRPPRATAAGAGATAGAGAREPCLSLVVVAPRDGLGAYAPDPVIAQGWVAGGIPHLYAGVVEATGVVGPLVLPGATPCAECLERTRTERDPARGMLLAQWRSGGRRAVPPACDTALASAVAGLAACHALSFVDGDLPGSTGARWEVSLPAGGWRRERVAAHPDCLCGASRAGGEAHSGGEGASARREAQGTMAG